MSLDIATAHRDLARTSVEAPGQRHWTITSPLATHWKPATCEQVGCIQFHTGWRIRMDTLPEADQHFVRSSGRQWSECVLDVDPDTGETYNPPAVFYVFEAGQPCFKASQHRLPVGRPELYLVGDRGQVRQYDRDDQWVEDCAEHTTKIVDKIKEG
jgi:hypothetical protein